MVIKTLYSSSFPVWYKNIFAWVFVEDNKSLAVWWGSSFKRPAVLAFDVHTTTTTIGHTATTLIGMFFFCLSGDDVNRSSYHGKPILLLLSLSFFLLFILSTAFIRLITQSHPRPKTESRPRSCYLLKEKNKRESSRKWTFFFLSFSFRRTMKCTAPNII